MRLQDLADVHPPRHAERVQHEVDRRAVLQERHVLDRHHAADHALVAVPARHLVARLQLALHRDEDLDHLHHAGRQLVAALQLLDLALEALLQALDRGVELALQRLDLGHRRVVLHGDLAPGRLGDSVEHLVGDAPPAFTPLKPPEALRPKSRSLRRRVEGPLLDRLLVVAVLGQPLDLGALDRHGALVLVHAAAGEHAHLDDRAGHARRQPQRGVAHVGRLLAEDRAEQLLLRRHRALALRRHLADQDVARVHLGADVNDARLVDVAEGFLADVRDVAGDLLLAELGVAGHHLEFLDVDRGEHVIAGDALRDQDRVLEVVAVPRHERAEHVPPSASSPSSVEGPSAMMSPAAPGRPPSPAGAG